MLIEQQFLTRTVHGNTTVLENEAFVCHLQGALDILFHQ